MKCSLCHTEVEVGTEVCPNCTADIVVDEMPVSANLAKKKVEPSDGLSKSTKIIVAVASILIIAVAGVFGIPKLIGNSTPESFADPSEVFKYLEVDCALGQPQESVDQGTGAPYTIVTCGQDYFALTLDKAETATKAAEIASVSMPETYHMYTLANSIVVSTTTASAALVEAHPELVLIK